ncbi:uncharacterized protein LOC106180652 isoform X1 [Lingula anatina]|uniref:Uncharacterized protein LOC106180652 isoform X1 n=1 Tax=Lingula anatina TaxID=7574 RepID=A0A1S3KD09_LINAN|nr:uncharacterized protein LOC106180652 isoform X1 [Lingula anatina]|eukprot:XP_013420141.1 uncharacterized protein LOC106180652 isoform X1 [Lingula anatina]
MASAVKQSPPIKSTLPNLLNEYGMPEEKSPKKKHHKKHHKKRVEHSDKPEGVRREKSSLEVEERKRIRDHKFQQMCQNPEKVRGYFFDEYKEKVKEKIAKQNEMYEKRVQELDQEIRKKEERMIKKGLAYRKKIMKRHDLTTDNTYLNKSYKSYYYKVLSIQEKLQKEGKLKTLTDVDAFWEKAKSPAIFEAYLSDKHVLKERFSVSPSSVPTSAFSSRTPSPSGRRTGSPSSPVPHFADSETVSSTTDQAQGSTIDQSTADWHHLEGIEEGDSSPSPKSGRKSEMSSAKTVSATQVAKAAAQQLEKRFPKQELPKLHCFTMELAEKPPDPEVLQREAEAAVREQKRKTFVKKLRRMYQLALTNQASSQRILAKHADEMKMLTEGPRLADLYESYDNTPAIEENEQPAEDPRYVHPALPAFMTESAYSPILEEDEDDLYSSSNTASSRSSSVYSAGSKSRSTSKSEVIRAPSAERNIVQLEPLKKPSAKSKKKSSEPVVHTVENKPPGLHPLTMGAVLQQEKVLEPKCVSTFWTNYMHAGKSIFAKST